MSHARLLAGFVLCVCASPAWAHPFHMGSGGFAAGVSHPFLGLDHLLAMIAVGIWARQIGGRALWVVPGAFLAAMAAGAALGFSGYAVPGVEPLIAASVLCLGLGIAARQRVGLIFGAVVVAVFAVFHGMAHAQEQPLAASIAGYAAGFMVSTALLHGIGLMLALRSKAGARLTGLPIAAAGFWMLARIAG